LTLLTPPNSLKCCNFSPAGWPAIPLPGRIAGRVRRRSAYGLDQLRDDLERFAFLPGGSNGESLFGPPRLT
jgi:hypothetical protein